MNHSRHLQHCSTIVWNVPVNFSDELNMQRTAAKFVPRLLSSDQKEYCIAVCTELKKQAENNPKFISTITTGDKSWVFGHHSEMKQQSSL
jgi:hypothetical protein